MSSLRAIRRMPEESPREIIFPIIKFRSIVTMKVGRSVWNWGPHEKARVYVKFRASKARFRSKKLQVQLPCGTYRSERNGKSQHSVLCYLPSLSFSFSLPSTSPPSLLSWIYSLSVRCRSEVNEWILQDPDEKERFSFLVSSVSH